MLRYGQDSITLMTAYCAVFLLRLLRSSNTLAGLPEGAVDDIHQVISKTADAYEDAAAFSSACTGASYHARFLRSLVARDIFDRRNGTRPSEPSPGLPSPSTTSSSPSYTRVGSAYTSLQQPQHQSSTSAESATGSASSPMHAPYAVGSALRYGPMVYAIPQEHNVAAQGHLLQYGTPHPTPSEVDQSGADGRYWDQMFRDIGFAGSVDATSAGMFNTGGASIAGVASSGAYDVAPGYQYMPSDAVGYPS